MEYGCRAPVFDRLATLIVDGSIKSPEAVFIKMPWRLAYGSNLLVSEKYV